MITASPNTQRGFSLIELMVAITIGLIILAAVSSVMVSSKKTYQAQDSLARLQENARAAMLILTYDMRNIGYWGCNPDPDNIKSALKSSSSIGPQFWFGRSLEGSEAGGNLLPSGITVSNMITGVTPRAGTDIIMIRGLDTGDAFELEGTMNSQAASLKVKDSSPFTSGEVLAVTDCNSADIFQVTNVTGGSGFDNLIHNAGSGAIPGNATGQGGKLSKAYGEDATVMRFKSVAYFVAPGASNEPSLWRQTLVSTGSNYVPQNQELVEGIENLQILYGVDTDGDKLPNNYVTADNVPANLWESVVSLRFGIIAREMANLDSRDARTATADVASELDTKPLDIDGDGVNDFLGTEATTTTTNNGYVVKDRQYQRRMFRTTVLLRNQQIGN
jgi:type IV pilus assembly protein PilW